MILKKPSTRAEVSLPDQSPVKNQPATQSPIASSVKTYKQLRDDIAAMNSNLVVAPDGIFTDYFINFVRENVQKSQLSGIFARALLEAGMNLHAQLNEDKAFTIRALQRNTQQISDIINSLKPKLPARPSANNTVVPSQLPAKPQEQHPAPPSVQTKPQPTTQTQPQSPSLEYTKNLSGAEKLKEFRRKSTNQPLETFYENSKVSPQWLSQALHILLDGQPLTMRNKEQMQGELIRNAVTLMQDLLYKYHITGDAQRTFLENVQQQVIAFMDNQRLQDQKQLPPSVPKTKTPHSEPLSPQPKKPVSEPQPKKPTESGQNSGTPTWLSPQQTLIIKELEIEILRYISQNQDASQEAIEQHFAQQVPMHIKHREILTNGIKATVGKMFQEPLEPEPTRQTPQISNQWIDEEKAIKDQMHDTLDDFFARHPQ